MNQSIEQKPSVSRKWHSVSFWLMLSSFVLLVVINLAFKFISLEDPFSGNHLFRQLQTLSTIEAYQNDGIDLLKPRANYIGYPGYLLLEFPIYQASMAKLSEWTGNEPLLISRVYNLIVGLLSAVMVYIIARIWTDRLSAAGAVLLYLFTPLNMMYHWSTLLDPTAVLFALFSFYVCYQIIENRTKRMGVYMLFALCSCLVVLLKPLYYLPVCLLFAYALIQPFIVRSSPLDLKNLGIFKLNIIIPVGAAFLVMLGWMTISRSYSSAQDISSHIGWQAMLNPGFYVTITLRYLFYIQTPLILLLGIFAIILSTENPKLRILMLLLVALPPLYYLLFANINTPHDYYSLILVPFLCIAAAVGLQHLSRKLFAHSENPKSLIIPSAIVVLGCILGTYLYIANYWIKPNLDNRYAVIHAFAENRLEPFQYSLVYVNTDGNFQLSEYLAESRRHLILAGIGRLDESKIRKTIKPIYGPPTLYAFNHQYGEMHWKNANVSSSDIRKDVDTYEGHLRYIIFYMFDQESVPDDIPGTPIHKFDDLVIYDLAGS